jgi:hypothetical protein
MLRKIRILTFSTFSISNFPLPTSPLKKAPRKYERAGMMYKDELIMNSKNLYGQKKIAVSKTSSISYLRFHTSNFTSLAIF